MVGDRIKLAREANCLSLRLLADRMNEAGISINRTSINNYENGASVPSAQMIECFAQALGVNPFFFTRKDAPEISIRFTSDYGGVETKRQQLLSYMQIQLELFIDVTEKLGIQLHAFPNHKYQVSVSDPESIETAVEQIRENLHIGNNPISSVCGLLEDNGWLLAEIPESFDILCSSGVELHRGIHFLLFKRNPHIDDMRFDLIREYGKNVLSYCCEEEDEVLDHFARAFLFPKKSMQAFFGEKRETISSDELSTAKKKYGLSRHNILIRLSDCNIINEEVSATLYRQMMQTYYMARSSIAFVNLSFYEVPSTLRILAHRAIAERLIASENELNYKMLITP
ncbi:MAG: helix-turn-helix transcriptional regulator [Bacillota bacterium]|nr:helix-turn-helix transcriptional regulator [Bacillota bacterium]